MSFSFLLTIPSSHFFVPLTGSWNSLYFTNTFEQLQCAKHHLVHYLSTHVCLETDGKTAAPDQCRGAGADEGAGGAVPVRAQSLSPVRLFATPWTVARQAPLSTGFFRVLITSSDDLPDPGIKPRSPMAPALAGRFLTTALPGNPISEMTRQQIFA